MREGEKRVKEREGMYNEGGREFGEDEDLRREGWMDG